MRIVQPIVLGQVIAPYGVNGSLRVRLFAADPASLLAQKEWYLRPAGATGEWSVYQPVSARAHRRGVLATLSGVKTRDAAAALRNCDIAVPRAALPPPSEGEYYWADLVGLAVVNGEGRTLGRVVGLIDNGAHAVLRFTGETDAREHLLPWVPKYVRGVDLAARRIDVDWQLDY